MMSGYRVVLFVVTLLISHLAQAWSDEVLIDLSESWAEIKYQMPKEERVEAFEALNLQAERLVKANAGRAEPLIWQGIILSTIARELGDSSALAMVKQARDLLEQAEAIDPTALNGLAYTTLGGLYIRVPRWPIGFGSSKKARAYLEKALEIDPNGIDPNYFIGELMLKEKQYDQAIAALEKALRAGPRENYPIADAGRRSEVEKALTKAKQSKQRYAKGSADQTSGSIPNFE